MEIQVAVSKIRKYASPDSGDTVEIIERPQGGISVVMVDGQSSGKAAKAISTMVVRKVITLLADGVRDGAAARAASDSLFTEKRGKVSASLNILSVDMQTKTLVISRNNPLPAIISTQEQIKLLDEESLPIGTYRDTKPVISEIPLEIGLSAVIFTDGLVHAGSRSGEQIDLIRYLEPMLESEDPSPHWIADSLLSCAIQLDEGRPVDDISVVVLRVYHHSGDEVRRMTVRLPVSL